MLPCHQSKKRVIAYRVAALVIFGMVMCASGCNSYPKSNERPLIDASVETQVARNGPRSTQPTRVPLVQLIADPDRFSGANVVVAGYLTADEPKADLIQAFLHLSREDASRHLNNYLPVSFIISESQGTGKRLIGFDDAHVHTHRYVMLHGKLNTTLIPAGVICQITRIDDLSEKFDD